MLFNSYIFILAFLPLTLAGYFALNHLDKHQIAKGWLLACSLFFYGYFNWAYLFIIVGSILLNFAFGRAFHSEKISPRGKKALLIIALAANLGVLFYYKYYDFFVGNINALFGASFTLRHLVLPLGISFFTFQQLSYVVDCYKGEAPPYPFVDYALFVTFFPQLIAGPIVLHSEIVPQFADVSKRHFQSAGLTAGAWAFARGLCKKVLVADTFGRVADWGFADIPALNTTSALLVMLAYTLQIYFDFSGYSDMATGLGRMFNIDIPMNFNSPYKALDIDDFWQRWHITLTRFFRCYLYIPLGGNRKGRARGLLNVFVVFVVSGLWHGANWTFVLWGAVHGAASVLNRLLRRPLLKLPKPVAWLLTFGFVNAAWVLFRAESLADALAFFGQMFSLTFGGVHSAIISALATPESNFLLGLLGQQARAWALVPLIFGAALVAVVALKNTNQRLEAYRPSARGSLVTAGLLCWGIVSLSGVSAFLYWNF